MRWIALVLAGLGLVAAVGCERRNEAASDRSGEATAPAGVAHGKPHEHGAHAGHSGHATHGATKPSSDADAMGGPRVAGASDVAERVSVVNAYCPILVGQSVGEMKQCDRRLVRDFKGQMVGFCDPECRSAWDGMNDEQRQKYLDEAMKLEAEPKPRP